mmetsp:Transcript_80764/g.216562  ORF Transcript_80764/g.216562 Transcript_80764/m.216562 type:complete len:149 (-) Transcript_80764:695-1141(-)
MLTAVTGGMLMFWESESWCVLSNKCDVIVFRCVVAPLGGIDFCKFSDSASSKRYCPDAVSAFFFDRLAPPNLILWLKICIAGQAGCACEDNVCPSVEKLVGLLGQEVLWAIIFLLLLTVCITSSCCVYILCCRPAPRQVYSIFPPTPQ